MTDSRMGKRKLEEVAGRLSRRDRDMLASLSDYRYLTTGQIRRLHFARHATELAALRCANRTLAKLKGYGLILCLPRRIGGVRAGSGAFVWAATHTGARIVAENSHAARKRHAEPSTAFLTHTLAVAEVAVRLKETAQDGKVGLLECSPEPHCWRVYEDECGKPVSLRPDLFAVTLDGDYEDHWFIEADLATERPVQVAEKCKQYLAYMKVGLEQKCYGVFPLVVWIVPDNKRRGSLRQYLSENLPNAPNIFRFITMAELEKLITNENI